MVGTLIGAGIGAIGSIFGGISASKAAKKRKRMIEQEQRSNQDWYDRRYNEDATQRADAVRLLTMTEDNIRNRNRAAAGVAAVTGSTEEGVAAAKETNNRALADAVSQVVANGERRKEAVENQYLARKDDLNDKLEGIEAQRANSIATATMGVAQAGANIAEILDDKQAGIGVPQEYAVKGDLLS